jgi:hypothetical protein
MARGVTPGMRRCPGKVKGVKCAHGELTSPLSIVWAAVEVALGVDDVRGVWERGETEQWARWVLLLPPGYRWASEQILWHVGEESRPARPGDLWVVVVSRAVAWEGAEAA